MKRWSSSPVPPSKETSRRQRSSWRKARGSVDPSTWDRRSRTCRPSRRPSNPPPANPAQTRVSVPHGGIMSTPGLRETRDYKNYIDGQWIASSTGKTFENRNPADNDDLIGTFQESNADDLNAAVDAADRAFNAWRLTPAPIRADYLYAAGNILKRDKEAIAAAFTA